MLTFIAYVYILTSIREDSIIATLAEGNRPVSYYRDCGILYGQVVWLGYRFDDNNEGGSTWYC